MKGKVRNVIIFILLVAVACGFFVFKDWMRLKTNVNNMQFIYEHFNAAGTLIDYHNDISMKNPEEDIKLFVKGKNVILRFGKIEMQWKMEEFVEQQNLENLRRIHITAFRDKETGRLRLFYKNTEIQRWVS